ncbi:MAG: DJ-1/PfpI family protein [candidate division Zixibacteria bacterium]|nr:DJ-1/PfpI family protein [candidate division Zixibacteria bacterium]
MKIKWLLLSIWFFTLPSVLAQQNAVPSSDERIKVAVLISDGATLIDFTAPMEVFHLAGMQVFTVAEKNEPVEIAPKMKIVSGYTLENSPEPDVIVVPGGLAATPSMIDWVKKKSKNSDILLSVCTGASFLAEAGMLDHLEATTYAPHLEHLQMEAPKAKIVSDKRVVDNGKIITTGGLSAGIDGALHVVEKMLGKGRANEVAVNMEYNWNPQSPFVRAQLADLQSKIAFVLDEVLHPRFKKKTLIYEGDRNYWKFGYEVEAQKSLKDLAELLAESLNQLQWRKSTGDLLKAEWKYQDEKKRNWVCKSSLQEVSDKTGWIRLEIEVNLQN